MGHNKASTMPLIVNRAIQVLIVTVVIGVARKVWLVIRHFDVRSPDLLIYISIFLLVISIILIYQLSKGRNWARWALLVILLISIPLTILPMFQGLIHTLWPNLLGLLQVVLYLISLVLLFHKNSSGWFSTKPVEQQK